MQRQNNFIYYWEGILDPNNLAKDYESVIQKIKNGEFRGLNFKKLRGHHVYSVRVNDTHRLLFSTVLVRGVSYLMLLDDVLNHDYHKSAFLKPSVLRNYLEMHGEAIETELSEACFEEEIHDLDLPVSTGEAVVYKPAEFFKRKFIEFNTDQTVITTTASLPLVISGAAGSGKSCVALSMLSHYAAKHLHDLAKPIVYVTESEKLCHSMRTQWQCLPISQKDEKGMVRFLTYRQLLSEFKPELAKWEILGKDECTDHIRSVIRDKKTLNKLEKLDMFNSQFYGNLEEMYQEWRIISGYTTKEEYLKLGDRQSLFENKVQRAWLFDEYNKYAVVLKNKRLYHLAFLQLDSRAEFELMVVDEAQDFSFRQIDNLFRLAKNEQICFCEDSRQSLADNIPKKSFFDKLLNAKFNSSVYRELRQSYRCPAAVVKLAGAVSELSIKATRLRLPSKLELVEGTIEGRAVLLTHLDASAMKVFEVDANSPDFAIVTRAEFKSEARERFHTELVFTPEEIKGLEYKKVMVYRLMAHEVYYQLNQCITDGAVNRDHTSVEVVTALNALYTACTRATEEIVLVEDQVNVLHRQENIISYLKNNCQDNAKSSENTAVANKTNSKKQWYDEAVRQLQEGNHGLAKEIVTNRLQYKKHEFEAWVRHHSELNANPVEVEIVKVQDHSQPQAAVMQSAKKKKKKKKKKKTGAAESNLEIQPANNDLLPVTDSQVIHGKKLEVDVRYIQELLAKPTAIQLKALFKKKNASSYLFHTLLKDGSCLFTKLFDTAACRRVFLPLLLQSPEYIVQIAKEITAKALTRACPRSAGVEANASPLFWLARTSGCEKILSVLFDENREIVRDITAEALCRTLTSAAGHMENESTIYWLCCQPSGRSILTRLFDGNPQLTREISGAALCRSFAAASHDRNVSALYWLCSNPDGRLIFTRLLENNPQLAGQITAEALCRPLSQASQDKNKSVLYWLCANPGGCRIITRLLDSNPQLAGQITAEALCRPLTKASGYRENESVLFWLSRFSESITIFTRLLDANPQLADKITAEALCLPLTKAAGSHENQSPLFYLSTDSEGTLLLKRMLDKNPALAGGITGRDLCRAGPKAGLGANESALYWLSKDTAGCTLLNTLLDLNPELAGQITAEGLCRACNQSSGEFENELALYWLSGQHIGRSFLTRLLDGNPQLAREISGGALCLIPLTQELQDKNKSALFRLSIYEDGISILNRLLEGNPKLAHQITADALCRPLTKACGTRENQSVLYWLSLDSDGYSILNRLFDNNPDLAAQITAEALCRACTRSPGNIENESALYCLSSESEGISVLNRLFKVNPSLAGEITAEALCRACSDVGGKCENESALYCLSSESRGITILNRLFKSNPALAGEITAEALCRARPAAAEENENESALYCLSREPRGITILNRLFDGNPELVDEITAEVLCRALTKAGGEDENKSVLYLLSTDPDGTLLLKRMVEENSILAREISGEALCRARTDAAGENENESALYWLSHNSEGCSVLNDLLDENSELACEITGEDLCRARTEAAGISENISALYMLCSYSEGISHLDRLFDENSELVEQITAEALCRACTEAAGEDHNKSVLYLLSTDPDGTSLLNRMLDENSKLAGEITGAALCRSLTNAAEEHENKSALYWLSTSEEGICILKKLFQKNTKLAEQIEPEALLRRIDDDEEIISIHSILSQSKEGISVLQLLPNSKKISASTTTIPSPRSPVTTSGLNDNGIFRNGGRVGTPSPNETVKSDERTLTK